MIWNKTEYAVSNESRKGQLTVRARMYQTSLVISIAMESGEYPNTHVNEIDIVQRDVRISDRTILDELLEGFEKACEELHEREGSKNAQ